MEPQYYMLDMPYALASWHKWAKAVYDFAGQYNHRLFTEDGLKHFRADVEGYASQLRNFTFIGALDLGEDRCYGRNRAHFMVGNEFSLSFIRIEGYYGK